MRKQRHIIWAGATCLVLAGMMVAVSARQKNDKDAKDKDDPRPKVSLKAQPPISMSPARIVLTAELIGGANDFQEFYCPTVVWEWGDDTIAEKTEDCDPYEPGKSEIKRHFTVEHVYRRSGQYRIVFRLKRHEKILTSAVATIQVRPGLREIGQ
jgi:hypothetical protein